MLHFKQQYLHLFNPKLSVSGKRYNEANAAICLLHPTSYRGNLSWDFIPAGSMAIVILSASACNVTHMEVLQPKKTKTNIIHGGNHPQVIQRSSHCHYTLVCPLWFLCLFKTANECCYCYSWAKE